MGTAPLIWLAPHPQPRPAAVFALSLRETRHNIGAMFTIEHDFDATVITLIDEGAVALQEDVTILAFEDCVTLEQIDPLSREAVRITLSLGQLADLSAALNLPEGSYRIDQKTS